MPTLISTVEVSRIAWLPQFILHYRLMGVQRFLISLHVDPAVPLRLASAHYKNARKLLRMVDVPFLGLLRCDFDAMALRRHHDRLQRQLCRPDSWIVWADIDEFHDYPVVLPTFLADLESEGVDVIGGDFVDRITEDGNLAPFNPCVPIWDQYPMGCDITGRILMGQTNKVVCSKGFVKIKHANHDPIKGQALTWARDRIVVHHFKWDASVIDRIRPRLSHEWRAKCHWWIQSQRAIEYIQPVGRISLNQLNVFTPSRPALYSSAPQGALYHCEV